MVFLKRKCSEIYIAVKDNIIRYDTEDSSDVQTKIQKPIVPENLKQSQLEIINKEERNITSLELSRSRKYIVVSTENKQVLVYDHNFMTIKNILVNRAPSKAIFTPSNDIVVADKTGDVYLYKLQDKEDKPVLLLGHLSVILDLAISECGKYIITSDRDEKIRVSHFPNCYNIASFCLGHTEFVNKIQIIKNTLVSASGDGTVRFWDFERGKQLGIIDTNADIESKNVLQEFTEQMSKEKVEILALPITDMQVHLSDDLIIAVSIYNYEYILLYNTKSNFDSTFITKVEVGPSFTFYLDKELFVFYNCLSRFKLVDNFVKESDTNLDKLYEKYCSVLAPVDNSKFTVFYKRKFDNVQDYLERKKTKIANK